jgi:hypothetical protein
LLGSFRKKHTFIAGGGLTLIMFCLALAHLPGGYPGCDLWVGMMQVAPYADEVERAWCHFTVYSLKSGSFWFF